MAKPGWGLSDGIAAVFFLLSMAHVAFCGHFMNQLREPRLPPGTSREAVIGLALVYGGASWVAVLIAALAMAGGRAITRQTRAARGLGWALQGALLTEAGLALGWCLAGLYPAPWFLYACVAVLLTGATTLLAALLAWRGWPDLGQMPAGPRPRAAVVSTVTWAFLYLFAVSIISWTALEFVARHA